MTRFYITFGSAHLCGFGLHYYIIVDAPNELLARKRIAELTDQRWAGIYTEIPRHGEKPLGRIVIFDEYSWQACRIDP